MVTTTRRRDQARSAHDGAQGHQSAGQGRARLALRRILSHKLLLIALRGRRTGRLHTLPVGYAQDGDTLYVLVGDYQTKA